MASFRELLLFPEECAKNKQAKAKGKLSNQDRALLGPGQVRQHKPGLVHTHTQLNCKISGILVEPRQLVQYPAGTYVFVHASMGHNLCLTARLGADGDALVQAAALMKPCWGEEGGCKS